MNDKQFATKVLNIFADVIENTVDQIECPDEILPDVIRSYLEACSMGFGWINEERREQVAWLLHVTTVDFLSKAQRDGLCLRHQFPLELRTSIASSICRHIDRDEKDEKVIGERKAIVRDNDEPVVVTIQRFHKDTGLMLTLTTCVDADDSDEAIKQAMVQVEESFPLGFFDSQWEEPEIEVHWEEEK